MSLIVQPSRWTAALFDLDGTLVDTRPGVRAAVAAAFSEVTGGDTPSGRIDLSLPLDEMIRSADPSTSIADQRCVAAAFRRQYDDKYWVDAQIYPGADSCLRELRGAGIRVFVVTNKRTSAAGRLLERLQLAKYVESVVGQADAGTPVPKATLARQCLDEAGLDPAATIVVGDSDQDASMAATCNMLFVAVTSGAGPLSHAQPGAGRVDVGCLSDVPAFVLSTPGRKP